MACFVEIILWYPFSVFNMFSSFRSNRACVRYDCSTYIYLSDNKLRMVEGKKIKPKRVEHVERREVDCRAYFTGTVWLEHCIKYETRFESQKDFLQKYINIVNGVACGKRNKERRGTTS